MRNALSRAVLAIGFCLLPAWAHAQSALRFEVEGLDLDEATVHGPSPDVFESSAEVDVRMAYNADAAPHAVVAHNGRNGVLLARLPATPFAGVTEADLDQLTFSRELVDAPFSNGATIVVHSSEGAFFKLGNAVESAAGVSFEVALLRAAPAAAGLVGSLPPLDPGLALGALAALCALALLVAARRQTRALPRVLAASLAVLALGAAAAVGQAVTTWSEDATFAPSDPVVGDLFGAAVAASGDTVVIGAPEATAGTVTSAGAAYVYVRSGSGWSFQQKLISSDPVAADFFGISVAIDGDTIAIGDRSDTSGRGAVYVYTRSGSLWTQQAKLVAADGDVGDGLGHVVAISGNTVMSSAISEESGALFSVGAVYVFDRSGSTWTQAQKLMGPIVGSGFFFGIGLDLSGSRAAIGTRDNADGRGAVYVYERAGGVFGAPIRVVPGDHSPADTFGDKLALDGDRLLASSRDDDLGTDAGAAYVFDLVGGVWTQQAKLLPSTGVAGDGFGGAALALEGDLALLSSVGADLFAPDAGVGYMFARGASGSWTQLAQLSPSDADSNDAFGTGLAIEGGWALVGARFSEPRPPVGCGRAPLPPCPPLPPNEPGKAYGFVIGSTDIVPPIVTAAADIYYFEATSSAGAVATFAVTATDDVDGPLVPVCTPPNGSLFGFGDTSVTCTATDAAGNTGTDSLIVRVDDNVAPDASCNDVVLECTGFETPVSTTCTATDAVDASPTLTSTALGSYEVGFEYYLCLALDDHGNQGLEQCSVYVQDTTPPTCVPPETGYVWCSHKGGVSRGQVDVAYHIGLFETEDLCDHSGGSIEGPLFLPSGCQEGFTSTVTYIPRDAAGNTSSCSTDIVVYDNEPPFFTSFPEPATLECNVAGGVQSSDANVVSWLGQAAVHDHCHDEALDADVADLLGLGANTVRFTATDSCTNTRQRNVTLSVLDTTPPSAGCENVVVECTGALTPVTTQCSGSDVCDAGLALISDAAPSYALGQHEFACHAQDDSGNGASASCQVTVIDTTAPVIDPIVTALDPVAVGTPVNVSAQFSAACGPHTGTFSFGDGGSSAATVSEGAGGGTASGSHVYSVPGVYTVTLGLSDGSGNAASVVFQYVVVYDPNGGYVSGAGNLDSPPGAYAPDPSLTGRAHFGFVAKYERGANVPDGHTQFRFRAADFTFESDAYEWLVVAGADAKYKGTGTVNGVSGYRFMLTATDGRLPGGGGQDRFHIKVWNASGGGVIYDNEPGLADDAPAGYPIQGGNIIIHAP